MMRTVRWIRWGGIVALLTFNVAALAVLASAEAPTPPWLFIGWFVGDAAVGLLALALTERP